MGIGEKIKGVVKQHAGDALDNDELQAEGEAQETKGDEQTAATGDKSEAKAHEKKADALEQEQKSLEN